MGPSPRVMPRACVVNARCRRDFCSMAGRTFRASNRQPSPASPACPNRQIRQLETDKSGSREDGARAQCAPAPTSGAHSGAWLASVRHCALPEPTGERQRARTGQEVCRPVTTRQRACSQHAEGSATRPSHSESACSLAPPAQPLATPQLRHRQRRARAGPCP